MVELPVNEEYVVELLSVGNHAAIINELQTEYTTRSFAFTIHLATIFNSENGYMSNQVFDIFNQIGWGKIIAWS